MDGYHIVPFFIRHGSERFISQNTGVRNEHIDVADALRDERRSGARVFDAGGGELDDVQPVCVRCRQRRQLGADGSGVAHAGEDGALWARERVADEALGGSAVRGSVHDARRTRPMPRLLPVMT